jgi:hypothetical protein
MLAVMISFDDFAFTADIFARTIPYLPSGTFPLNFHQHGVIYLASESTFYDLKRFHKVQQITAN